MIAARLCLCSHGPVLRRFNTTAEVSRVQNSCKFMKIQTWMEELLPELLAAGGAGRPSSTAAKPRRDSPRELIPSTAVILHCCPNFGRWWLSTRTWGRMARWCTASGLPTSSTPSTAPRARSARRACCWTGRIPTCRRRSSCAGSWCPSPTVSSHPTLVPLTVELNLPPAWFCLYDKTTLVFFFNPVLGRSVSEVRKWE